MSKGVIIGIVITILLLLIIAGIVVTLVVTGKDKKYNVQQTSQPTVTQPTTVDQPMNQTNTQPVQTPTQNIIIPTNVSSPAENFTLKNGDYTLSMDGKDLKVKRGTTTVWSSGVFNDSNPSYANSATVPGPYKISLQNDGNLVVYGANNFVWSAAATSQFYAPEPKKAPYKLTLESDGQINIKDSNGALVWKNDRPEPKWSSCTNISDSQEQCRRELFKKYDDCRHCGETKRMKNPSDALSIERNGDAWCRNDHGNDWFYTKNMENISGLVFGVCAKNRHCFCDY